MGASGPTGQVANADAIAGMMSDGFDVNHGGNGASANFIFANLNGSISAWNGKPTTAQAFTQTSVAGASFTGLAINQADTELFAANTAGAGGIDVFNNAFQQISLGAGAFATPTAVSAKGLVPFNVTDLGGNVFVTYAPSGHTAQTMATAGEGAVAEFSESGVLEKTITNDALASPWGVAIAPIELRQVRWRPSGRQFQLRQRRGRRDQRIQPGDRRSLWAQSTSTPARTTRRAVFGP